jgi:hypothetical protein
MVSEEIAMLYFEEAKGIWQSFVPKSGQSATVQGELLRAVEKLRDEATRNGNGNWDEGFEILLRYLEKHLLDPAVFQQDLLATTKSTLSRLRNFEDPYLADDLYDALTDRVVECFRFYGSQPHVKNPSLHR